MAEDIQQQVIALIAAFNASGRLKKGVVITPETEINTALNLSFSDSNTLMRRYFDTFGVDSGNYNHELYFQPPANTGRWFSPPPAKNTLGRCACRCWCVPRAPNAGCTISTFLSNSCARPDAPLNPARPEENRLRPARRRRHRCATHSR